MDKKEQFREKAEQIFSNYQEWSEDKLEVALVQSDFKCIIQDLKTLVGSAIEEELKKFMTWVIKEADIEVVGVNAIEVGKLSGTMATPVLTMEKFIKYYLSLPKPPKNKRIIDDYRNYPRNWDNLKSDH